MSAARPGISARWGSDGDTESDSKTEAGLGQGHRDRARARVRVGVRGNGRIVAWWWHAHLQFFYDATSLGSAGIPSSARPTPQTAVFFSIFFRQRRRRLTLVFLALYSQVSVSVSVVVSVSGSVAQPRSGPGLWARSAQRDEWLAKMFECDHELDLSHNLKSQSQSLSQVKSSQLDALHTRHVNQAQRHGHNGGSSRPSSSMIAPWRGLDLQWSSRPGVSLSIIKKQSPQNNTPPRQLHVRLSHFFPQFYGAWNWGICWHLLASGIGESLEDLSIWARPAGGAATLEAASGYDADADAKSAAQPTTRIDEVQQR